MDFFIGDNDYKKLQEFVINTLFLVFVYLLPLLKGKLM